MYLAMISVPNKSNSNSMTLTQLEYIIAIDTYRHFSLAAEKCFVTQPTLSMQIQKLEEECCFLQKTGISILNFNICSFFSISIP